jgi:glycerate dehydrogenase
LSAVNIVFLDAATTSREGDIDFGPLQSFGDLILHDHTLAADTAARSENADVLLTNKVVIDAAVMDACKNLQLIQVCATGTNNVDLDAASERGIPVCNVSGYSTAAVVQHTFALILNLTTNVHRFAAEADAWPQSPFFTRLDHPISELAGKTLGIAGLGTIGSAVADVAEAFGMKVVALARPGSTSTTSADRLRLPAEKFFAESDVISLHCPLTPDTEKMVNAETLQQMPDHAFLINTGRGPLVDEDALLDALRSGVIAGAGLDVLSIEPPAEDHPLIQATAELPTLLITPHTAWSSVEARRRLMEGVLANIGSFLAGDAEISNRVA